MTQYNPKNIDKALERMEKSDTLKDINRSDTNIMSFFNDIEEENHLEKQKSAAELKKEQYLEKINSLKKLVKNVGTTEEINRITAMGALIYNSTPSANGISGSLTNPAVAVLDFSTNKTSTAGTFTITFPTADASNAIIRIA